jgi:hypothetical protein
VPEGGEGDSLQKSSVSRSKLEHQADAFHLGATTRCSLVLSNRTILTFSCRHPDRVKKGPPNGRPHLRWNLVSGFQAPFLRAKKAGELANSAIASFHLLSINTWLLAASCRCPKELWSRAKKFSRGRISEGSDAGREADSEASWFTSPPLLSFQLAVGGGAINNRKAG